MFFSKSLRKLALVLIATSITIVMTGHAMASNAVCGGEDLLGKMEAEQPALYAKVGAEAAKTSNGDAVFWKIDGNGAASPSYLLGTIHMTDSRVATLTDSVKQALQQVGTVALEIADPGDQSAMAAAFQKRPDLMILQTGSLWDHVDPATRKIVAKELETIGIPSAVAGQLQPWLPAMTLSLSLCETKRNQAGHNVLDKAIGAYAKQQGAKVVGLESIIEQFTIMSSMSIDTQLMFLNDAAKMRSAVEDMNETMIQAYLDRKVTWFIPFSRAIAEEQDAARQAAEANFMSLLLDKRNQNMAERAENMLKTGNAMIAVGALHLPGDNGLVELFRKQGFTVTAID